MMLSPKKQDSAPSILAHLRNPPRSESPLIKHRIAGYRTHRIRSTSALPNHDLLTNPSEYTAPLQTRADSTSMRTGGGLENIFPHHESEVAQSEAATGRPFTRFWLHNNMVTVDGRKMGKSLGNFVLVRDILSEHDPMTVRLYCQRTPHSAS